VPRARTVGAALTSGSADDAAMATVGCADVPLSDDVPDLLSRGGSVVTATGTLQGVAQPDDTGTHQRMVLSSVRTLAGPAVGEGTTVELDAALGPEGPVTGAPTGALWAADGALFGFVVPGAGPASLRIAPVVDGDVVLSSAGCWSTRGLDGHPFTGELAEVPGSDSYARTVQHGGLTAVPLTAVAQVVDPA
jgi:hypothetical protein